MRRIVSQLVLIGLIAGLLVSAVAPAYAGLPPSEWVIGPRKRLVMLTFDGQMKAKHLADVLDTLEQRHIKATFFISGSWIDHHTDKARSIVKAGHILGNRGYSTTPFTSMSSDELRNSISKAQSSIASVGGSAAPFLRAPKGARNLSTLRTAGDMGYRSVRWTYRAGGGATKAVVDKVTKRAQAGAILSLEAWRKSHRKALGRIIDELKDRKFAFRTVAPLTRSHAVRWDVTIKSGSSGAEVAYLQKKLRSIAYPAGKADGKFGYATLQSVYAFEKYHGLARDGVVTPAQMTAIAVAQRPRTPERGPRNFVDVDVSKQILLEVRRRKVVHILPVSTGNEEYYEVDGERYKAHTPRGSFKIERKIPGKRVSRLGTLYHPSYFIGGYAFHGSPSVPTYPASHGCVRIPMYQSKKFYERNPIGTYVFIHD